MLTINRWYVITLDRTYKFNTYLSTQWAEIMESEAKGS